MATKPTTTPPPTEDARITLARKNLTESKQAVADPDASATWWGRMEGTVAMLLAVIDEAGQ